jgi:hypothetical protein
MTGLLPPTYLYISGKTDTKTFLQFYDIIHCVAKISVYQRYVFFIVKRGHKNNVSIKFLGTIH